jgi:hypothetical protein
LAASLADTRLRSREKLAGDATVTNGKPAVS